MNDQLLNAFLLIARKQIEDDARLDAFPIAFDSGAAFVGGSIPQTPDALSRVIPELIAEAAARSVCYGNVGADIAGNLTLFISYFARDGDIQEITAPIVRFGNMPAMIGPLSEAQPKALTTNIAPLSSAVRARPNRG